MPLPGLDLTDPLLSRQLWEALGRPSALPPGLCWEQEDIPGGRVWQLRRRQTPIAPGAIRLRAFSCAELTRMLPGQIETLERTYCGIMIWGEGVYELRYESAYIKGDRPEPYVRKWSHIFPRPIQQPSEILAKARMLLHLLEQAYLTPPAALQGLSGRLQ